MLKANNLGLIKKIHDQKTWKGERGVNRKNPSINIQAS